MKAKKILKTVTNLNVCAYARNNVSLCNKEEVDDDDHAGFLFWGQCDCRE
jgi:hypothetical protein